MKKLHAKCPLCHGPIVRYGGRRRFCVTCQRTFRIRIERRGRKKLRINRSLLEKIFLRGERLSQQSLNPKRRSLLKKRFRQYLLRLNQKPIVIRSLKGKLILIADGLRFRFKGSDFVLYLPTVKSIRGRRAFLLEPSLLPGAEAYETWSLAIGNSLTKGLKRRIVALVADNFRGCEHLVLEGGWHYQRCHFHLLHELQRRLGRRRNPSPGSLLKEEAYQLVRFLIRAKRRKGFELIFKRLGVISSHPLVSSKYRSLIRGFLSDFDSFRTYRHYPKLNLPVTTNALESMAKIVRKKLSQLSTPASLEIWVKALVRMRRSVVCNGYKNQPN